jgi:hypothetical protein
VALSLAAGLRRKQQRRSMHSTAASEMLKKPCERIG